MQARELIEWSLTLRRVQKLVICRGFTGADSGVSCGALGYQVGQALLAHCAPSPSDIHDAESRRAPSRDAHGRARAYYSVHRSHIGRGNRRKDGRMHSSGTGGARSPQTWDSERVADFGGTWCDRLLLGDHLHPQRSALLLPKVPAPMEGDAVSRAAQTLRHLTARDVLVVTSTGALPFGVVRLHQGRLPPELARGTQTAAPHNALFTPLNEALNLFGAAAARTETASQDDYFVMWMGSGDEDARRGLRSVLLSEAAAFAKDLLLPLTSFAVALWATNPDACADYLERTTATATTLTTQTANKRLWRTMQASMLSTRDTALLDAHFSGKTLDARLSPQQQNYLAETLLRRLEEPEERPLS